MPTELEDAILEAEAALGISPTAPRPSGGGGLTGLDTAIRDAETALTMPAPAPTAPGVAPAVPTAPGTPAPAVPTARAGAEPAAEAAPGPDWRERLRAATESPERLSIAKSVLAGVATPTPEQMERAGPLGRVLLQERRRAAEARGAEPEMPRGWVRTRRGEPGQEYEAVGPPTREQVAELGRTVWSNPDAFTDADREQLREMENAAQQAQRYMPIAREAEVGKRPGPNLVHRLTHGVNAFYQTFFGLPANIARAFEASARTLEWAQEQMGLPEWSQWPVEKIAGVWGTVADTLRDFVQTAWPTDPEHLRQRGVSEGDIARLQEIHRGAISNFLNDVLPRGAGSMAQFLVPGVAAAKLGLTGRIAARVVPAIAGAVMEGASGIEEARSYINAEAERLERMAVLAERVAKETKDETVRAEAARLAKLNRRLLGNLRNEQLGKEVATFWAHAAAGTLEALPVGRMFDRAFSGVAAKSFGAVLKNVLIEGSEEAIQEAIQQFVGNATALALYDADRSLWDGMIEAPLAGFITAGMASGMISAAGAKPPTLATAPGAPPIAAAPPAEVVPPAPPTEPVAPLAEAVPTVPIPPPPPPPAPLVEVAPVPLAIPEAGRAKAIEANLGNLKGAERRTAARTAADRGEIIKIHTETSAGYDMDAVGGVKEAGLDLGPLERSGKGSAYYDAETGKDAPMGTWVQLGEWAIQSGLDNVGRRSAIRVRKGPIPTEAVAAPLPPAVPEVAPGVAPAPPVAPGAPLVPPVAPERIAAVVTPIIQAERELDTAEQEFGPESPQAVAARERLEEARAVPRRELGEEGALKIRVGPDLDQQIREAATGDAAQVQTILDAQEEQQHRSLTDSARRVLRTIRAKVWDASGNVKAELQRLGTPEAQRAIEMHDLVLGSSSWAAQRYRVAEDAIFADLSVDEERVLRDYLPIARVINIAELPAQQKTIGKEAGTQDAEVAHPGGMTADQAREWVRQAREAAGDRWPKIERAAQIVWDTHLENVNRLYAEGLLGQEAYDYLTTHHRHYHPRRYLHHIDPDRPQLLAGARMISVPDSGIQRLQKGSEKYLLTDVRFLLAQSVARTEARIARNRANLALLDLARTQPDNGVAVEGKVHHVTKTGNIVWAKPPKGWVGLRAMEKGHQKLILMPEDVATEWVTYDPQISRQAATTLRWASGSPIVRTFATGVNPAFAVANPFRDIPTIWASSLWLSKQSGVKLYSINMPIAAAQMKSDLDAVASDVIHRRGLLDEAIEAGMGMEFLVHQGRILPKLPLGTRVEPAGRAARDALDSIYQRGGWLGETSELMTRLMLYRRAKLNGADNKKAAWIARAYLDFNQGGSLVKAADNAMPYTNAAIQVGRTTLKALAARPGAFAWQVSQMVGVAFGIAAAGVLVNDDAWKHIGNELKDRYFVFTLPDWLSRHTDDQGRTRWWYLTVPKPEFMRPIALPFEAAAERLITGRWPDRSFWDAAESALEILPTVRLPPTVAAFYGYMTNTDFWSNDRVWKGRRVTPESEVYLGTHPAFVSLGQAMGLSPVRLEEAATAIVPPYNPFVTWASLGTRAVLQNLAEPERQELMRQTWAEAVGLGRIVRRTSPVEVAPMERLRDTAAEEAGRRHLQNLEITRRLARGEKPRHIDKEYVRVQPKPDRERLFRRLKMMARNRGIDPWWLALADLPPEARAAEFHARWKRADTDGRRSLTQTIKRMPEIVSDRFRAAHRRLIRLEKQAEVPPS